MNPSVLLYTTGWCPFCRRAKALLRDRGVRWIELDVEEDPAHRRAMNESSGRDTVPQIFINGTHVGGCDELVALDAKGGLNELLARTPPAI